MKKLQNNFTTQEQSKRLLELGVPAYSADCYIHISECLKYNFDKKHEEIYKKYEYGVIGGSGIFGSEIPALLHLSDGSAEYLPCWSVGRLIEIVDICCKLHLYEDWVKTRLADDTFGIPVEHLVSTMEYLSSDKSIDFSKLWATR